MPIKKKPTRQIKRVPRRRVAAHEISYKDPNGLERYLTDEATILSRPETGLSQKMQRKLATAVKRARHLALLPFTQTL